MGPVTNACCGARHHRVDPDTVTHDMANTATDEVQDHILGLKYIQLKDRLPIASTHINYFVRQVKSIGKDKFEVDDLRDVFPNSIEWNKDAHYEEDSELRQFLLFMPDTEGKLITLQNILCLGLIWCRGDLYNKAEMLFELLNPPENQTQDVISCTDKEFFTVLNTIITLSAGTIINFAYKNNPSQLQRRQTEPFKLEKAAKAMIDSEIESGYNGKRHLGFISLAFGTESILKREDFVEAAMSSRCRWIFDSSHIRSRMKYFLEEGVLEQYDEE